MFQFFVCLYAVYILATFKVSGSKMFFVFLFLFFFYLFFLYFVL